MDSNGPADPILSQTTPGELIALLWRSKWLIVVVTLTIAAAAAGASMLLPRSYKAMILLSPAASSTSGQFGSMGALASQFGGLASLAGIAVGGDNSQKAEAVAVLQSEALTEKYIRDNDLLPVLYRSKWDETTKSWKSGQSIPTLWKANAYFKKKVRSVQNDPKTGLVTLSITLGDPRMAARWANDLVRMTNEYLRDKAVAESERNIAYLNEEAAKISVLEARQAVYKILEGEINKAMLARGNPEFAFKVLDPAVAPERATSPDPVLWVLAACFGGLFLSSLFVVLRNSWAADARRQTGSGRTHAMTPSSVAVGSR